MADNQGLIIEYSVFRYEICGIPKKNLISKCCL